MLIRLARRFCVVAVLLAGASLGDWGRTALGASEPPSFLVKVLAPLGPSAGDHYANAINDNGVIVGEVSSGSAYKGFVYHPSTNGSAAGSSAIAPPKRFKAAVFNSINDSNEAAGYVCLTKKCSSYLPYAGILNGSKFDLVPLRPPNSKDSVAYGSAFAINGAGTIVGYEVMKSGQNKGLKWKLVPSANPPRWSKPTILPRPKTFRSADGVALDSVGDVGGYGVYGNYIQATIAGSKGHAVPLRGLTAKAVPAFVDQTEVSAIQAQLSTPGTGNRTLTVVGDSYVSGTASAPQYKPVVWQVRIQAGKVVKVGKPVELGPDYNQPSGASYGEAMSIDKNGWIVGLAAVDDPTPMLWIAGAATGGLPSFAAYQLQPLTPEGSPACAFTEADSVNNKGQIVGVVGASTTKFIAGRNHERLGPGPRQSAPLSGKSSPRLEASGSCQPPSYTDTAIFVMTPTS